MARFRRMDSRRPIDSVKHIVEISGILAAGANTVLLELIKGVDTYSLADTDGVPVGSNVNSIFLSVFFITEGGEVANEVPLVDWYTIKNPGFTWASTFNSTNLPTPGTTGTHVNKRHIFHTEKGLSGGGDVSLAGVPMIFKGVLKIPRHMRRIGALDTFQICARANFATKFCVQAIYKHYK